MENIEGTAPESAISTEQTEKAGEAAEGSVSATAPQEQKATEEEIHDGGEGSNTAEGTEQEPTTPFLSVKHNHENRELSQEEAVDWVQKGMKYESVYGKLCRAAALSGKEPNEFISSLEKAADERYRQELIDKYGDNPELIDQLMEHYEMKKESTISAAEEQRRQAAMNAEQDVNRRIAADFEQMKKDFPDELTDYASLPAEVKRAASEGMPLAYAYLLHKHTEGQKTAQAAKSAAEAASKSTGSMATDGADSKTEAEQRYLSSLWGK